MFNYAHCPTTKRYIKYISSFYSQSTCYIHNMSLGWEIMFNHQTVWSNKVNWLQQGLIFVYCNFHYSPFFLKCRESKIMIFKIKVCRKGLIRPVQSLFSIFSSFQNPGHTSAYAQHDFQDIQLRSRITVTLTTIPLTVPQKTGYVEVGVYKS